MRREAGCCNTQDTLVKKKETTRHRLLDTFHSFLFDDFVPCKNKKKKKETFFPPKNVFVICYRPSKAIKGSIVGQKTDEMGRKRQQRRQGLFTGRFFFVGLHTKRRTNTRVFSSCSSGLSPPSAFDSLGASHSPPF